MCVQGQAWEEVRAEEGKGVHTDGEGGGAVDRCSGASRGGSGKGGVCRYWGGVHEVQETRGWGLRSPPPPLHPASPCHVDC